MVINHNTQCPVCGRKLETVAYPYEHHKVLLTFCSAQCRENFQAHPILYTRQRTEPLDRIIKRRKLRLSKSLAPATVKDVTEILQATIGVESVSIKADTLIIHYDLLLLTLMQLERLLEAQGISLADGWWHHLRRGWWHNTEATELDNLAMPEAACCSRPPPGAM